MNEIREVANYGDSLVLKTGMNCIKMYRPWLKERHIKFYQRFQTFLSNYSITLKPHYGVELTINGSKTIVKELIITFLPLTEEVGVCSNVVLKSKNRVVNIPFIEGNTLHIHGYYNDLSFDDEISYLISQITGYSMYSRKWNLSQSCTHANAKIIACNQEHATFKLLYTDICMDIDGFSGWYNTYFAGIIHTILGKSKTIGNIDGYSYIGSLGTWDIKKIS